jgi:hypothetical protein
MLNSIYLFPCCNGQTATDQIESIRSHVDPEFDEKSGEDQFRAMSLWQAAHSHQEPHASLDPADRQRTSSPAPTPNVLHSLRCTKSSRLVSAHFYGRLPRGTSSPASRTAISSIRSRHLQYQKKKKKNPLSVLRSGLVTGMADIVLGSQFPML